MPESLFYKPWLKLKKAVTEQQTWWLLWDEALEDVGWPGSPREAHPGIPGQGPVLSGPGFLLGPFAHVQDIMHRPQTKLLC